MAIDTGALYYLVDPFVQWENVNGKPIVGGHVEVFEAGTDNKIITYADWDGTRHPFKIPLGSDGRAVILVDPGYRYDAYVYDSFNNLVCSRLNIIPLSDGDITIDGMGQVYHDETLSGKGTPNSPLTVISGGKVYGGIYPIDVNNELDMISADNVPLGVQEPLYFAQDDDEGLVIALSSVPVPEGTMNESAFGYEDGKITGYNGSGFSAGLNYEAGSYVDIDGNTINVTGLQPAGNYQSAGDYVVHDELSSYATQDWVENQSYMKEYMESAFYPSTSNPSGYLTEHQDLSDYAKTEDLTAYQEKGNYYSASNPSGFINSDAISSMATTGFVADVSADITALIPTDLFTKESADTLYQPIGQYQSALTFNYTNDNEISGINGSAIAGQSVTGDFELVGGTNIELVDDPVNHTTTINMTADIPSTAGLATTAQLAEVSGDITAQIPTDLFTKASADTLYQPIGNYLSSNALEGYATEDWVTAQGYLTAHQDLSDYQTTAGMTAYQPAGNYLTAVPDTYLQNTDLSTTDGKVTAISGIPLSAGGDVPEGVMVESGLEYDASGNISAYSGSAFAAQLPEEEEVEFEEIDISSISAASDYISANSANIDSTVTNVSANSGAWGGSALPISGGTGIKFDIVDNTLLASTDETVLYENYSGRPIAAGGYFDLTESPLNFEYVEIYLNGSTVSGNSNISNGYEKIPNHQLGSVGGLEFIKLFAASIGTTGTIYEMGCGYSGTSGTRWTKWFGFSKGINNTTADFGNPEHLNIWKVIGINRIAGGN